MDRRFISFKQDWNNKLSCQTFTTIRKCNDENLDFYTDNICEVFDVELSGSHKCYARLIGLRRSSLSGISEELVMVDTGSRTYEEALDVFAELGIRPGDEVLLLLFYRQEGDYASEAVLRAPLCHAEQGGRGAAPLLQPPEG